MDGFSLAIRPPFIVLVCLRAGLEGTHASLEAAVAVFRRGSADYSEASLRIRFQICIPCYDIADLFHHVSPASRWLLHQRGNDKDSRIVALFELHLQGRDRRQPIPHKCITCSKRFHSEQLYCFD